MVAWLVEIEPGKFAVRRVPRATTNEDAAPACPRCGGEMFIVPETGGVWGHDCMPD